MFKSRFKNSLISMLLAFTVTCSSARAGKIDWIDDAATIGVGLVITIGLGVITYNLASSGQGPLADEETLDQILQMISNYSLPSGNVSSLVSNVSSLVNDTVTYTEVDDTVLREVLEMLSYIRQNIGLSSEGVINNIPQITPVLENLIVSGIEGIRNNVTQVIDASATLAGEIDNMCGGFSSQFYYASMAWINSVFGFGIALCEPKGTESEYYNCLTKFNDLFTQARQAY